MSCTCCQKPPCVANFAVREVTGLSDPDTHYASADDAWNAAVANLPDINAADWNYGALTYIKTLGSIEGATDFSAEAGDLDYKIQHFNAMPYFEAWWDEITDTYAGGVPTGSVTVNKNWLFTPSNHWLTGADRSDSSTWPSSPIYSWTHTQPTGATPCSIVRSLANFRYSCDDGYIPNIGDPDGFPVM